MKEHGPSSGPGLQPSTEGDPVDAALLSRATDLPVTAGHVPAVPVATVKADSPADAPSTDSPFKDDIDPTSDGAAMSHDWRKRWTYKYGDAWKKSSREGKWSDRVAPSY